MSFTVELKSEAQQDLSDQAKWYENEQQGLGEKFLHHVIANLEYLKTNPLSFPCKYKQNRELVLKKFPYIIVYRVLEQEDKCIVLAIAHCKQHPVKKRL